RFAALRPVDFAVACFTAGLFLVGEDFFDADLRPAAVTLDAAFDAAGFAVPLFAAFFSGEAFEALARIATGRSAIIVAAARERRCRPSISAIALPSSAGLFTMRAPASSSARNLSAAVPLPPEITAPACPMRLPA